MQKLYSNLRAGEIKIRVTNPDDLWSLSQIIEQGDIVKGLTTRKVKLGENGDSVKKTIFIIIRVESVEFHEYQNILRVSGKVTEAPEDIPRGSYHTLTLEQDTVMSIVKEHWPSYQLERLNEALEERSMALICVFDREDAYIALLKKYKYELLLELHGTVQKKDDPQKVRSTFYAQIIASLKEYSERFKVSSIILASPAFWREYLMEELKDEALKKKIRLASCSSATVNAIEEVLKSNEVKELLKQDRVAQESKLVDELFLEISKDGLAAYGLEETKETVNAGAVRMLLIADSLIIKMRQEGTYGSLERLMKQAEALKAAVILVSAAHESGKKLEGLGGIAALLRYKFKYQ